MKEQKNIFRKENLDRISSPEKLNDYIKVSNIAVWVILGAIASILITVLIWSMLYELPDGMRPIEFLFGG